ncbi:ribokinase [Thermobrachium celere]|uniref:Ribokinase n=1 Tax=Thermobrachium celere DSM 8682 TaxID=941824 RepID=R7RQD5_9CLOT|nr:ribokinase [Thermobrachium celere]CDF57455.1 Ribokinase [Thermobrachium celere DSM 8682]
MLIEAVKFANKVSAIAVTREGAQSSIPYMWEFKGDIWGGINMKKDWYIKS